MTEADAPHVLQRLALAKILNPLMDNSTVNLQQIDAIYLVPDAEIWETPAIEVCDLLTDFDGIEINVETRDSAQTPGIQIADLLAYSLRSYKKDNSCEDAAEYIRDIRL